MARRIAIRMAEKTQREPQIGTLDINLYRDDLTRVASQPVVQKTEVPPNIDDRDVVLVDDVLYTGRTIRAALDALCDFGRMRTIQLAVLIVEHAEGVGGLFEHLSRHRDRITELFEVQR